MTALSCNQIGIILAKLRRYDKALEYFNRSVTIYEKLPEHEVALVANYVSIGVTYEKLGNKDKAVEYLQKAIDIARQKLGENHQTTRQYIQILQQIQAQ